MPDRDGAKRPAGQPAVKPSAAKRAGRPEAGAPARKAAPPKPARKSALTAARAAGNGVPGRKPAARAAAAEAAGTAVQRQPADAPRSGQAAGRLGVRKTYKLFIGGAFPRSESGRSYPVTDPGGALLARAAQASRKDARDAVVAARAAVGGWSGATAYNRGQVLYRVAELLEGRRGNR